MDIYVYNQYQNQGERSYLAVPFFYSSKGYGLYLDSNPITLSSIWQTAIRTSIPLP